MKRLLLPVCALFLAVSAFAQSADEIIDKHLKALGGVEKLRAMQSIRATGKLKMGPMEAPVTLLKARPDQMRMDFTIQGMTGTQAYDGSTGWMVMPFMGKKDPEKMSEDMLKNMMRWIRTDAPADMRYLGQGANLGPRPANA